MMFKNCVCVQYIYIYIMYIYIYMYIYMIYEYIFGVKWQIRDRGNGNSGDNLKQIAMDKVFLRTNKEKQR